ncbi:MAG TPA: protein kinase [Anaerolineales bacterium]|nr:protein kinase [Anaerolineales bacterium]
MVGQTIARYQIQSEIGRGGMAAVYLAHDPNFRRNVAIKVVSVNFQDNFVFKERFEREAHLIARIEHPAIVPVYDFGEQNGQPYLVMRYMPGGSLAAKIKERPFTFREAAQIVSQIAPALDAVHAQGIVHRDLKPGNILFDGFGNPAISDFGIAHFSAATSDLTGSAIIGTPSYMSPEQVRGDEELDGRSDIYALGVILFEMLTGRGPFHASTPMSVALKHLTDPVPSIRLSRPDLPLEVERILDKALAKDREMRYPKATELALDLTSLVNTFPDHITPAPISGRPRRGEEKSTEVDAEEGSQRAVDSPSVPPSAVPLSSNPAPSQKFPAANVPPSESINPTPSAGTQVKPSSRRILQIIALGGVGLLLLFLCSSLGILGTWASLGLPDLFSGQDPTASPTGTATQASTVPETVLFSDDFSDPLSGWPILENNDGKYSYQTDGYHIVVHQVGAVLWATTDRQDTNASISVDARPLTEDRNGYYGLLCRIQDDQNFYYFVIQPNGDYTIGKYKNAEFQSLFPEGWRRSDAIQQGTQTDRLKADCVGKTLRLYVNDVLLGEATDTDFTSGFSGMLVAALDTPGFEVTFDNFMITEPSQ